MIVSGPRCSRKASSVTSSDSHRLARASLSLLVATAALTLLSQPSFAKATKASVKTAKKPVAAAKKPAAKPKPRAAVKPAPVKPTVDDAQDATPAEPLKPYTQEIANSLIKFDMTAIPGGMFTYTDPVKNGASHTVKLKPFWMGTTEMTWDLYDRYVYAKDLEPGRKEGPDAVARPSRPYVAPDRGFGHTGYPIISEGYQGATKFCEWLSKATGKKYRLPTEIEWEYACRAGRPDMPLSGADLDKVAWFDANSDSKTHPVAQKAANPWGLYDMLGNVMEWCQGADGKPIARGGSWVQKANQIGCAARFPFVPAWQQTDPQYPKSVWWLSDANFLGFRVVCEP